MYNKIRLSRSNLKWRRRLILVLAIVTGIVILTGTATAYRSESGNGANGQPIYLYYFYFTPRCDECIIVENALLKVLNEYYSQALKNKQLIYKEMNLTDPDPESKKIIQDLKVRRQLLLMVSGDTVVNLTRDAFRYAEDQYELFRNSMKNAIDQALSQHPSVSQ